MAHQIGDYILRGELRNTRANGVYGWLEFAPDVGVHVELTGNLRGQLSRKHIKFSTPRSKQTGKDPFETLPEEVERLADRQIGVIGDVNLSRVRVPTIPLTEFTQLDRDQQDRFSEEKDCLYLEWYSQNGRVVAEIIDPDIEFLDERQAKETEPPEFESTNSSLDSGIAETYLEMEGRAIADADLAAELAGDFDDDLDSELDADEAFDSDDDGSGDDESDDPYGLFAPDLDRSVADALKPPGGTPENLLDEDGGPVTPRSWDEVIPGLDPEIKAMYEQWDEIFEGKKDEPVSYLFETPLRLPPPDRVTSDEEAQSLVVAILAQLALLSVAVDVCEHYTPQQTYHLLMTEILPTAKVHPNLAASRMVQHYSTSDHCDACEAAFDAQYNADQLNDDDEDENDSEDIV
ncbi:MAG: hypothetical protein KDA51_04485 [Planctomycetales bacterium]|nr:hypothetical protein [Planctomycetales bacterium]